MPVIDYDTTPPELCEREDCCNPSACVCDPNDPCHHDALERQAKRPRPELEMPPRG